MLTINQQTLITIKCLQEDKEYRRLVSKFLLGSEFMMLSLFNEFSRPKLEKSGSIIFKGYEWQHPTLTHDMGRGYKLILPNNITIKLSTTEFDGILQELEDEHEKRVGRAKSKAKPTISFDEKLAKFKELLPKSVENTYPEIKTFSKNVEIDGKKYSIKAEVSWDNEHRNAYGNTLHITGTLKDDIGLTVMSGAIGEEIETLVPELEGLYVFHGMSAYDYNFVSNIVFNLASSSKGVEYALNKILYKDGEDITMSNLLDKDWLLKRQIEVVIPELQLRLTKLGFTY